MKIYLLGSCSGTEPMPGRHHTSLVLEQGERLYWFDAGENCSHTAYLMGLDLMKISDIFISHMHLDHTGGLANLLWTIRKLHKRYKKMPLYGDITVHLPQEEAWPCILGFLKFTEGGYQNDYETLCRGIREGVVLERGDLRISARGNAHLRETEDFHSFSFLIEAEGKRIIYSGDVRSPKELEPWLRQECDLLLMETGHHDPEEVCRWLKEEEFPLKQLCFMHHGRTILADPAGVEERCRAILPHCRVLNDKDTLEI